jgi:hypothetical protein
MSQMAVVFPAPPLITINKDEAIKALRSRRMHHNNEAAELEQKAREHRAASMAIEDCIAAIEMMK